MLIKAKKIRIGNKIYKINPKGFNTGKFLIYWSLGFQPMLMIVIDNFLRYTISKIMMKRAGLIIHDNKGVKVGNLQNREILNLTELLMPHLTLEDFVE